MQSIVQTFTNSHKIVSNLLENWIKIQLFGFSELLSLIANHIMHEYTIYRQREMNQLESDYDRAIRQLSLFSGSTEQLSGETSKDED